MPLSFQGGRYPPTTQASSAQLKDSDQHRMLDGVR
jgi:hypothetical protein